MITDPKTAENLPRWAGAPRDFFEVYYVKWNDLETGSAGWVRYTFFGGKPFAAECGVWGIFVDPADPESAFAAKATYPAAAASLADRRFEIVIGDSGITNERAWGTVRDAAGRQMRWDLRVAEAGPMVRHIPAPLRRGPLPSTKFVAPEAWNALAGTVEIDGRTIAVDGAVGHQAHFWGGRQVEAWTWGNCGAFREDPSFRFEGVVGFMKRRLPPMTCLFFQWEGRLYELNGLLGSFTANSTAQTLDRWEFAGRTGDLRFRGTMRGRPERMFLYRHYDPDGAPRHSHNDFTADLAITIDRREGRRWREVAAFHADGTAAFEVAQPERDPRVTREVEQAPPQPLAAPRFTAVGQPVTSA